METKTEDLFPEHNKRLSESIRQSVGRDKKIVVIGPPRAGKSFFIENYLSAPDDKDETIGILEVDASKWNLTGKLKEYINDLGNRIKRFFGGGVKDLASLGIVDIGDARGVEVPEEYVNHLKELKKEGKQIVFYSIPPTEAKELVRILDEEKVKFIWLGKEYIPPGLLKLMKDEKKLREQLRLYKRLNKLFGINVEEGVLLLYLSQRLVRALTDKAPDFVSFIAGRFGSLLQPVSLLVEVLITALIFDSLGDKRELYKSLFETLDIWTKLDEELKCLTAANLAFIMRLTPEVVYNTMEKLSNEDVKKEIEKLKEAISLTSLGSGTIVFPQVNGEDLIGLGVYNGKIYEGKNVYNLVTVRFEDIAKEIEKSLINSKGKDPEYRMFFIVGSKGIGKSTLVHYVIADLLQKNEFTWAVRVSSPNINPWAFRVSDGEVILFYDYYPYEAYTSESPARIGVNVRDVVDIIESLRRILENHKNAYAIIVLSDDILSSGQESYLKDLIDGLPQQQKIPVELHSEDFIREVVKSYSGCSNVGEVAKAIVDNYKEGGYTLLAKYAGLWLKVNNCNYGDVKKVLEESKNEPKMFLKKYINTVLEQTTMNWYAIPLLIHVFLGEVPIRVSEELPFWLNDEKTGSGYAEYAKAVAPWIATRKEDLVEEALEEYLGDLILGRNLKEYRKEPVDINILKYVLTNGKLKEIIKSVNKSIKDYFTELKNAEVNDRDLDVIKDIIGYDEGLRGQDFYAVLEGWASGGNKASDKHETVIYTVLSAVIREFLRDKLLEGGQEIDRPNLELLLRLADRTALQESAIDLFDEANGELKEYIFTESREVPNSIRYAVHGLPPFINGLFNKSGDKYVKPVNSSWCEYLERIEVGQEGVMGIPDVAAGAALYLLSIPEELSDECKEKIIDAISALQEVNKYSIYAIGNAFLRFLVKNNSLNDISAYELSAVLTNIPLVEWKPDFLRVLLEAGYRLKDKIKDDTLKKIYTIGAIRGLIALGELGVQIDKSIISEAESLMSLEDEILLPYQAGLANGLMSFYLFNDDTDARKLAERLEKVGESLDKVNWDEVAGWFNKKGIEVDKDGLKEDTKAFVFYTLAQYYRGLYDIGNEKKYIDAYYDAIIKMHRGEEEAKKYFPNDYFLALIKRDTLNAILGEDLSKALEMVVKDSEEAFTHSPSIGTGTIQIIIREYLIASAYLGRLDKALEVVNDDYTLRYPLLSMGSEVLLELYSLFYYLTGGKFRDKVMEYAKTMANNKVLSNDEPKRDDRILDDIDEKPVCSRAISEIQRGLVRDLGLNESDASDLIYIFLNTKPGTISLNTKPGTISLLSLSMFFSGLEVVKGLAECLAEHRPGEEAELLTKVSKVSDEEEFKDALVRLAMYLFL
ncbi:hypothetical protein [Acidianus sp. HS-5]|uniref:hypothetical protein n=1 Tax=Acidianus sp. HS-5 TaxID=2886040 RepID=UPI001F3E0DC1|nr:hypothetical protein [Acidianus sp. HS-5]BDC18257.1 hypothetical protein HS5_11470 [Acidianus sp. HS-5]